MWCECAGDDDEHVPGKSNSDLTEVIWIRWYYPW